MYLVNLFIHYADMWCCAKEALLKGLWKIVIVDLKSPLMELKFKAYYCLHMGIYIYFLHLSPSLNFPLSFPWIIFFPATSKIPFHCCLSKGSYYSWIKIIISIPLEINIFLSCKLFIFMYLKQTRNLYKIQTTKPIWKYSYVPYTSHTYLDLNISFNQVW